MINSTRGLGNKIGKLIGMSSIVDMRQVGILESDIMLIVSTNNLKSLFYDSIFYKSLTMTNKE